MNQFRFVLSLILLTITLNYCFGQETGSGQGNNRMSNRPFLRALTQRNAEQTSNTAGQQEMTAMRQNNSANSGRQQSWFQQQRQKQQQVQKQQAVQQQQRLQQLQQQRQNVAQRMNQQTSPTATAGQQNNRFHLFKPNSLQQRQAQQRQTQNRQGMTRSTTSDGGNVTGNTSQTGQTPSAMVDGTALQSTYEDVLKPSTSKSSAMEALRRIPWNSLTPEAYRKAESIVSNYSVFRRLPLAGGYCNPELFDYCLLHPEVVIGLWRGMGYSQISMKQEAPDLFSLNDQGGTVGKIEVLYHDNENILVYCLGSYKAPVGNRALEGEILLMIQTRYSEDNKLKPLAICRADSFVKINNVGIEMVSKVFAPMLGKVADANFSQTVAFVGSISELAEKSPKEMYARIDGLTGLVDPKVQEDLYQIAASVWSEASERTTGAMVEYKLSVKKNQPQESYARIVNRKKEMTVAEGDHSGSETPSTPNVVVDSAVATGSSGVNDMEGIRLLDSLPKEADLAKKNSGSQAAPISSGTSNNEGSGLISSPGSVPLPEMPSISENDAPETSNNGKSPKKIPGITVPITSRRSYSDAKPELAMDYDNSTSELEKEIRPLKEESKNLPAIPFDQKTLQNSKEKKSSSVLKSENSLKTNDQENAFVEQPMKLRELSSFNIKEENATETASLTEEDSVEENSSHEKTSDSKEVESLRNEKSRSVLPVLTFANKSDVTIKESDEKDLKNSKSDETVSKAKDSTKVYEPVFARNTVTVQKATPPEPVVSENNSSTVKKTTEKSGSFFTNKNSESEESYSPYFKKTSDTSTSTEKSVTGTNSNSPSESTSKKQNEKATNSGWRVVK